MLNIPNVLTILRLAMIPFVPMLFALKLPYWALGVYLLAGATDVLDGYLARRLDQVTKFGKLVDPLADKLMLVTVLLCLQLSGHLPLWICILAILKETLMIIGAVLLYRKDIVIQSNLFGKAATLLFTPAVVLSFFQPVVQPWHVVFMAIALVAAYVAMAQYAVLFLRSMREKKD